MRAKTKKQTMLHPLAEALARDAQRKRALDRQFWSFYKQMKKAIRSNAELRDLEVPLEKVKESIQLAAYGMFFGVPMVRVAKPKNWEG
jgi:hypothetical protein